MHYGISNVWIHPKDGEPFAFPGATKLQIDTSREILRIVDGGETQALLSSDEGRFSATLESFSYLYPLDEEVTMTYEYLSYGRPSTGIIINAFLVEQEYEVSSVNNEITPTSHRYNIDAYPALVNEHLTSHILVESRLVGPENYRKITEGLIRQNGIENVLSDVDLQEREFQIIRDENGIWEVSGPGRYIASDGSHWSIDKIRNRREYDGTFTLIDDY